MGKNRKGVEVYRNCEINDARKKGKEVRDSDAIERSHSKRRTFHLMLMTPLLSEANCWNSDGDISTRERESAIRDTRMKFELG